MRDMLVGSGMSSTHKRKGRKKHDMLHIFVSGIMLQNQATYSFVLKHSYNVLHTGNQLNDLVEFSWINQEDDEKASTRPIRFLTYEYVLIIF